MPSDFLLIDHVRVRNANAVSSPLTYGFPAITAFMGFGHCLQRLLSPTYPDLEVTGLGIIHHELELQTNQSGPKTTFCLTANPLKPDGKRPSTIEEGRCHLVVSLVLEVSGLPDGQREMETLCQTITKLVMGRMKLAGGDIMGLGRNVSLPHSTPKRTTAVKFLSNEKKSLNRLMPGYALIGRSDLMIDAMDGGMDGLDSLYHHLTIHHRPIPDGTAEHERLDDRPAPPVASVSNRQWEIAAKPSPGWLVPIAAGFHGITDLRSDVANRRDSETPHRFAESVVTMGEFKMPIHFDSLESLIWRYQHNEDLYLCVNETDGV